MVLDECISTNVVHGVCEQTRVMAPEHRNAE